MILLQNQKFLTVLQNSTSKQYFKTVLQNSISNVRAFSCFIFLMLLAASSQAQPKGLEVYGLPNLNKGYLIWNCDDPDREFYRVYIIENSITPSGTSQVTMDMHELHDINYLKIKDDYWKIPQADKWYTAEVKAYDDNNNVLYSSEEILQDVLSSAGPEGGFGEVICNWECVSSNYAYRIMATDYNGFNYSQRTTFDYYDENAGIGVPHYRWFSDTEFSNYTGYGITASGTGSPEWHGMPDGWQIPDNQNGLDDVGGKIIRLDNSWDSYFCDSQGGEITSPEVWGIQKALGPWAGGEYYYRYGYGSNLCEGNQALDLGNMIIFMNNQNENNLPNIPTLACSANLAAGCGPNGGHTGGGFNEVEADAHCGIIFDYTANSGGGAFGAAIDSDFGCLPDVGESIDGVVGFGTFLASTELFQIVRLDENPKTILLSSGEDYVDSTGTPISMSINLDPGLYKILAKTPNKGLRYTLADVKNNTNISLLHKDYFDALVFPNPLTDDIFKIHIQTSARLNVQYDIYDAQGNPLWSQKFNLPKDHDADHTINHNVQLPSGVILHKFEFEDGSIETYTSLKM